MSTHPVPGGLDLAKLAEERITALTERFHDLHEAGRPAAAADWATDTLELIAVGATLARFYAGPALVHRAVLAGASWAQIAEARGQDQAELRLEYGQWVASHYESGDLEHGDFEAARAALMPARRNPQVTETLDRAAGLLGKINGGQ
jgi:hypothetical protein